jgi:uncharacterized membrane protein (DUF485 family)
MSPIEIAKAVYFVVLIIITLAMYTIFQLNVSDDPSYMQTPTAVKSSKSRPLLGLVITVGILLLLYVVVFCFTCFRNFIYIRELSL